MEPMAVIPPTPQDADAALPSRQSRPRRRNTQLTQVVPKLSVVIVNYHDWRGTARLARRVMSTTSGRDGTVEVVVVDNHSPVHPIIDKLRHWPGVSLRRWRYNRGFSRAANEACRLSRGDWLLLLNPDVSLPDEFLEGVLDLTERLAGEHIRAGVVGFRMRHADGSSQWSAGPWPTLTSTLAGMCLPRAWRKCRPIWSRRRRRVAWVTGCCVLIRRECWEQLQGFDEEFFLYYEDVDFCRRARDHGWSVWLEPSLHAVHHHPLHVREVPPHIRLSTRHALLTYAAKHWSAWQSRLMARIVHIEARLRQWWSRWHNDEPAAGVFSQLAALAADFLHGRRRTARRRLDRTFRQIDAMQ